ncbi:MAG: S4 domain-containing protein, partial [Proteobacteria bacterium]|nr:S4 domain-containing protein [Pseudomonadota bacterium]
VSSKSEARRLIQQNAIQIDGKKINDINHKMSPSATGAIIKAGKRKFLKIT